MREDAMSKDMPWADVPITGPFLRPKNAADYIGLSLPRYYHEAAAGRLPAFVKLGGRASGVPQPWLDAVIQARVSAAKVGG
jgi:predicted DNA-binding transcriptional regulator AlpA